MIVISYEKNIAGRGENMIRIGLIGLGTVNTGVYEIVNSRKEYLESLSGTKVAITKILVKNIEKERDIVLDTALLTDDPEDFLKEEFDIVVEAITNLELAYYLISESLKKSSHVVTASKAVVSKYFNELFDLADKHRCGLYIEASVAGGVPIIKPMLQALSTNDVSGIKAILNGTTNFILSKMYDASFSFNDALELAQKLGFAEADPTDDIEGYDALRKLAILSSIAYKTRVYEDDIPCRGITSINGIDIEYFKQLGLIAKLIGTSSKHGQEISASIEPILFSKSSVYNTVNMSNNIVSVTGDNVGELQFYGQGAGKLPTANSIVSDIVDILSNVAPLRFENKGELTFVEDRNFHGHYYVRISLGYSNAERYISLFTKNGIDVSIVNRAVDLVLITENVEAKKISDIMQKVDRKNTYIRIESDDLNLNFLKDAKPILVQKYGGSSLSDAARIKEVAKRIVKEKQSGKDVVVVVSAMGNTTDNLVKMASNITDNPSKRELDMLLSTGEQISISLLAMAIKELDESCISLTGSQSGIITDDSHSEARIIKVNTERINQELANDNIVIIAGFQGSSNSQDITTLGRGGSDTTATAVAVALNAEKCEILTDVKGVYSANPSLIKDAKLWDRISYDEMLELASLGAKILHPRSVELVKKHNMPLVVRSSFSDHPGTEIVEASMIEKVLVRGITHDDSLVKVSILDVPDKPGIAYTLFKSLADKKIVVDIIIQAVGRHQNNDISFTIPKKDLTEALVVCDDFAKTVENAHIEYDEDIVKLSLVGIGMSSNYDVAATLFKALYETGINIQMISTSEMKISCIVKNKDVENAIKKTHDYFQLGEDVSK